MNNTITVPASYIKLASEVREAQEAYFAAAAQAKKQNTPAAWQERKEALLASKALESTFDQQTAFFLGEIHGKMSADEAIKQMRLQLDGDLDEARKEATGGN